jgi:hypothetical protein
MRWWSVVLIVCLGYAMSLTAVANGSDPLAGLKQFGDFPKIDIKKLLDGEILSARGPLMKFPNGISSQLVFAVPATPEQTLKRFQTWDPKRCPALKVYESHDLSDPCVAADFSSPNMNLDPGLRPVKWFLDQTKATSGKESVLNLTQIEAVGLANCVAKDAGPQAIASCWANLLFHRASSFQRDGFASMFSYDFDVEPITPAMHLRSMLLEQPGISREFAPILQRAGLLEGPAGSAPLRPSYFWRLFQADHHATLSLGAAYDLAVGDRYQRLEVEYYVSGTYYTSATLYEIWPVREGGKTGSLVWCDVLCSAPTLRFASGIERLASGVILVLEFKKMVRCFQDSFKNP